MSGPGPGGGARLGLAALAFVVALGLLEIGMRILLALDRNSLAALGGGPPPAGADLRLGDLLRLADDDRVVFELRPGLRGRFLGHELATNTLGFRDRERVFEREPGTLRIAGLGDSHAFGWAVDREETFYSLLEAKLAERLAPRPVEVWNLGVPGYNTVQEVRAFELLADRIAPGVVVVNYVHNDMDLPNFLAEPPRPLRLDRSALLDFALDRLRRTDDATSLPFGLVDAVQDPRSRRFAADPAAIPERYRPLAGWEAMEGAFLHLAALARGRGIPVVLLLNADDYRARLRGKTDNVLPSAVRDLAVRLAAAGFVVVDPQDHVFAHLREHGLEPGALWISATDSHTSPLRHRLVAEVLAEKLIASGIATGRPSSP